MKNLTNTNQTILNNSNSMITMLAETKSEYEILIALKKTIKAEIKAEVENNIKKAFDFYSA